MQAEIARALPNANDDPEDAVKAACSLIEAACRSILIELRLSLPAKKDIDGLIRAIQELLDLSLGRTDLPAEVEQDTLKILSGLTSVAKGIGALRTHGGDAHSRETGYRRIDPRIARLAINAASSPALFLIETWERKEHRALPPNMRGLHDHSGHRPWTPQMPAFGERNRIVKAGSGSIRIGVFCATGA
ncbi:abortive infection family protein [Mesorhizobium tianshanense]|uniref:Abortive infection Abi-like protein n=1 Tax=Mesorhizobium tianshanense TaxID=39844 RepID=A0A562MBI2_9HYPH|nr:abortive infection family protein [Mesorhizobium tianshanense]TWI17295.1 abortive infection Abi-like protein [Mesorhizobium tianshanense]